MSSIVVFTVGVLLLELYTRDGIGMMVFSDDYEVSASILILVFYIC